MPASQPASALKQALADAYGFAFPDDFWAFWQFYQELQAETGQTAPLSEDLGIAALGPFRFVAGEFAGKAPRLPYYMEFRYFMDPPEFFTVLCGDVDGEHWGYWLDDPARPDFWVASYYNNDAYGLSLCGRTLFEAVRLDLEWTYRDQLGYRSSYPSEAEYQARLARLDWLRERIMCYATAERPQTGDGYIDEWCASAQPRAGAIATSEGMGIRVPPDTYRAWSAAEHALIERTRQREISADDLATLVELAQSCARAGAAGNALQIGRELWSYGKRYSEQTTMVLDQAYRALGRDYLAEILQTHMQHRYRRTVDILADD